MDNYSKLYWLTRLDSMQNLCVTLALVSGIGLLFYWIIYAIAGDVEGDYWKEEYKKTYGTKAKVATWIGMFSLVIVTFLPSKNEAILIFVSGKTIDFIQNDKSINKIPAQTTQIVSDYLDKTLKEMKNENVKSKSE